MPVSVEQGAEISAIRPDDGPLPGLSGGNPPSATDAYNRRRGCTRAQSARVTESIAASADLQTDLDTSSESSSALQQAAESGITIAGSATPRISAQAANVTTARGEKQSL